MASAKNVELTETKTTGHVARFSTSGLDGRLCVWGATDVAAALAQLRV